MPSYTSTAWNLVRGLEPVSFCDWPGKPSAVLFFGGCNMRCPTCHNASLAWQPEKHPVIYPADLMAYLTKRSLWLDGLVITGGEPTLVPELPGFLDELKEVGLPIKLDTNGLRPGLVGMLLEQGLVQEFHVDVKGPWEKYPDLTGGTTTAEQAHENLEWIFALARQKPDAFLFRTTQVPLLDENDIETVKSYIPQGFTLKLQEYVPPRRMHAQADTEERRMSGNMVHGQDRSCDSQGAESQRSEGSPAFQTPGPQGGAETRQH